MAGTSRKSASVRPTSSISAGFRVVATKPHVGVYALSVERGRVFERRLPRTAEYLPLEMLHVAAGAA